MDELGKIVSSAGSDETWFVQPKPGFCVKFKAPSEGTPKSFFNFATCPQLPPPSRDVSEEELGEMLERGETAAFRVPLSVGERGSAADKGGQPADTFDILINADFFQRRVKDSLMFKGYLTLVGIEAVKAKHGVALSPGGWSILQNRRVIGDLQPQHIRRAPSAPLVQELPSSAPPFRLTSRLDESGRAVLDLRLPLGAHDDPAQLRLSGAADALRLDWAERSLDVQLPVPVALPPLDARVHDRVLQVRFRSLP